MKMLMRKLGASAAAGVVTSTAFAQVANAATGPDFSTITGAIAMDSVSTAVMAVGAMVVGVILAVAGVKVIIRQVRSV
ncbi:major capsid protein [Caballeronia sp. AZ7_KS35]|uniref:major capsid protein n=1 Tax=Caballeronia sp. AZ7_KS35 TaxID=2921762 RepID=UPI00202900C6|nr:major capsid protein [Caballeronia sp. AZ7_KS35]